METQGHLDAARRTLLEAEAEYRDGPADDYVLRSLRDAAIVEAHRAGLSSREIGALLDDPARPESPHRAFTRREVIPDGLLSPVEALRTSGLDTRDFIDRVHSGRLRPVALPGGVRAFRSEDIEHLRALN